MKPEEILERRNMEADRLRQQQLDRIESIVAENHRALRGSNGNTGLVAAVDGLKNAHKKCSEDIAVIKTVIYGHTDDIDDKGIIGEQQVLREIAKKRVWVNRVILTSGVAVLIDILVKLI